MTVLHQWVKVHPKEPALCITACGRNLPPTRAIPVGPNGTVTDRVRPVQVTCQQCLRTLAHAVARSRVEAIGGAVTLLLLLLLAFYG